MTDYHQDQRVLIAGKPLDQAKAAMIMIHGRGATAENIISLSAEFKQPDFTYLAPQANDNTWYPYRFMEPIASNEPYLTSALNVIADLFKELEGANIPAERTIILGFSQGACLSLEYVARHAQRYGGAVGLSGGLIGPDGTPRNYPGSLAATPIFMGCSDVDFHIPKERVIESAEVLKQLGGDVTMRLYPQMGHTIIEDEIEFVKGMMATLIK
jgi:phospholipase/carboxylesterase